MKMQFRRFSSVGTRKQKSWIEKNLKIMTRSIKLNHAIGCKSKSSFQKQSWGVEQTNPCIDYLFIFYYLFIFWKHPCIYLVISPRPNNWKFEAQLNSFILLLFFGYIFFFIFLSHINFTKIRDPQEIKT